MMMGGMGGFNPAAVQLRKTNRGGATGGGVSHPTPTPAAKPATSKFGAGARTTTTKPARSASQDETGELMAEISKLKTENEDLKRENDDLKRQVEDYKRQVEDLQAQLQAAQSAPQVQTPVTPKAAPTKKTVKKPAAPKAAAAPPPPPPQAAEGEPYKALYAFAGEQPGDLVFKKGDIIYVQKMDGAWWEGTCNGSYGPFPSYYVLYSIFDDVCLTASFFFFF